MIVAIIFAVVSVITFVTGQDLQSANVSVCFNDGSATIPFIYNPPNGDRTFRLVSWQRKLNSGGGEEALASLDGKTGEFSITNAKYVGKINRTGEFGLIVFDLKKDDSGEYSIVLRTNNGTRKVGKGMLNVEDPCLQVEREKDCYKISCLTTVTSPQYSLMTPGKNSTEDKADVCSAGTVTCCVMSAGSSDKSCTSASLPSISQPSTSNVTMIVVPIVVVAVVVIIGVIIAVVLYRKRKQDKSDYNPAATAEPV